MHRHLRVVIAVLLAFALLPAVPGSPFAPQPAQAATATFTSDAGVGISRNTANPYPSTINVAGVSGTVLHVSLTLNGLFYQHSIDPDGCNWDELDILLAGPGGQVAMVMSDVARNGNGSDAQRTLTFDDNMLIPLPSNGDFESGSYFATDYEPGDTLPAPAPVGPYGTNFSVFTGAPANGLWSLYARSERTFSGCQGGISSWSLTITDGATFTNAATITLNERDVATPYPSTMPVSGMTGRVKRVTAELSGLSHQFPHDMDVLLVNPTGIGVILLSDAASGADPVDATLVFADEALRSVSPDAPSLPSGSYKPTNHDVVDDPFPDPAPDGPYAVALSAFTNTDPNGVWSLYIVDDLKGGAGQIAGGWRLSIETDSTPPVTTASFDPPRNAAGWNSADVIVTLNATDASGVQRITYSAAGAVMIAPTTTLSDTVPVNIAAEGITTLRFSAIDNFGNAEQQQERIIRLDKTDPSVSTPVQTLAPSIGASDARVRIAWTGADAISGVASYVLQQRMNGGTFTQVTLPSVTATSITLTLAPASYEFRVRAFDRADNGGAFVIGPRFRVSASEESRLCSSTVTVNCLTYRGTWVQETLAGAHGGKVRTSSVTGNTATFTFTGSHVSWATMKGPDRGRTRVVIDGVSVGIVDLYAPRNTRAVAYINDSLADGPHTLVIRVLGTKNGASSGTKVVVDVMSVLRRE